MQQRDDILARGGNRLELGKNGSHVSSHREADEHRQWPKRRLSFWPQLNTSAVKNRADLWN
jgi:hypothetical protein